MNYLDRNEFNFEPSQKVLDAVKNFDPKDLCFYTRIYDQGKKSVISVRLSEIYGVPEERVLLAYGGEEIIKNLGSPKAIRRMTSYLIYVKPRTAELVVDEMLAICSDISAWKDKKASEEANAAYNDWLNNKPF